MSEATTPEPPGWLEWDLADRLNKALRHGTCKPGEMRLLLGVSESTMTNYLNGITRPKDGMLRVWARRCRVPFVELRYGLGVDPYGPEGGPVIDESESACTRWFEPTLPFRFAA